MLQVFFITILTLKNFTSLVLTSVEVLEHCHDFRAQLALKRAIITLREETETKRVEKVCSMLPLYNTNGHSQQTWICFSHIYNFYLQPRCADFAKNLAKIDTEMLIPEGRKLPLEVEKREFWQLFQSNFKQQKISFQTL